MKLNEISSAWSRRPDKHQMNSLKREELNIQNKVAMLQGPIKMAMTLPRFGISGIQDVINSLKKSGLKEDVLSLWDNKLKYQIIKELAEQNIILDNALVKSKERLQKKTPRNFSDDLELTAITKKLKAIESESKNSEQSLTGAKIQIKICESQIANLLNTPTVVGNPSDKPKDFWSNKAAEIKPLYLLIVVLAFGTGFALERYLTGAASLTQTVAFAIWYAIGWSLIAVFELSKKLARRNYVASNGPLKYGKSEIQITKDDNNLINTYNSLVEQYKRSGEKPRFASVSGVFLAITPDRQNILWIRMDDTKTKLIIELNAAKEEYRAELEKLAYKLLGIGSQLTTEPVDLKKELEIIRAEISRKEQKNATTILSWKIKLRRPYATMSKELAETTGFLKRLNTPTDLKALTIHFWVIGPNDEVTFKTKNPIGASEEALNKEIAGKPNNFVGAKYIGIHPQKIPNTNYEIYQAQFLVRSNTLRSDLLEEVLSADIWSDEAITDQNKDPESLNGFSSKYKREIEAELSRVKNVELANAEKKENSAVSPEGGEKYTQGSFPNTKQEGEENVVSYAKSVIDIDGEYNSANGENAVDVEGRTEWNLPGDEFAAVYRSPSTYAYIRNQKGIGFAAVGVSNPLIVFFRSLPNLFREIISPSRYHVNSFDSSEFQKKVVSDENNGTLSSESKVNQATGYSEKLSILAMLESARDYYQNTNPNVDYLKAVEESLKQLQKKSDPVFIAELSLFNEKYNEYIVLRNELKQRVTNSWTSTPELEGFARAVQRAIQCGMESRDDSTGFVVTDSKYFVGGRTKKEEIEALLEETEKYFKAGGGFREKIDEAKKQLKKNPGDTEAQQTLTSIMLEQEQRLPDIQKAIQLVKQGKYLEECYDIYRQFRETKEKLVRRNNIVSISNLGIIWGHTWWELVKTMKLKTDPGILATLEKALTHQLENQTYGVRKIGRNNDSSQKKQKQPEQTGQMSDNLGAADKSKEPKDNYQTSIKLGTEGEIAETSLDSAITFLGNELNDKVEGRKIKFRVSKVPGAPTFFITGTDDTNPEEIVWKLTVDPYISGSELLKSILGRPEFILNEKSVSGFRAYPEFKRYGLTSAVIDQINTKIKQLEEFENTLSKSKKMDSEEVRNSMLIQKSTGKNLQAKDGFSPQTKSDSTLDNPRRRERNGFASVGVPNFLPVFFRSLPNFFSQIVNPSRYSKSGFNSSEFREDLVSKESIKRSAVNKVIGDTSFRGTNDKSSLRGSVIGRSNKIQKEITDKSLRGTHDKINISNPGEDKKEQISNLHLLETHTWEEYLALIKPLGLDSLSIIKGDIPMKALNIYLGLAYGFDRFPVNGVAPMMLNANVITDKIDVAEELAKTGTNVLYTVPAKWEKNSMMQTGLHIGTTIIPVGNKMFYVGLYKEIQMDKSKTNTVVSYLPDRYWSFLDGNWSEDITDEEKKEIEVLAPVYIAKEISGNRVMKRMLGFDDEWYPTVYYLTNPETGAAKDKIIKENPDIFDGAVFALDQFSDEARKNPNLQIEQINQRGAFDIVFNQNDNAVKKLEKINKELSNKKTQNMVQRPTKLYKLITRDDLKNLKLLLDSIKNEYLDTIVIAANGLTSADRADLAKLREKGINVLLDESVKGAVANSDELKGNMVLGSQVANGMRINLSKQEYKSAENLRDLIHSLNFDPLLTAMKEKNGVLRIIIPVTMKDEALKQELKALKIILVTQVPLDKLTDTVVDSIWTDEAEIVNPETMTIDKVDIFALKAAIEKIKRKVTALGFSNSLLNFEITTEKDGRTVSGSIRGLLSTLRDDLAKTPEEIYKNRIRAGYLSTTKESSNILYDSTVMENALNKVRAYREQTHTVELAEQAGQAMGMLKKAAEIRYSDPRRPFSDPLTVDIFTTAIVQSWSIITDKDKLARINNSEYPLAALQEYLAKILSKDRKAEADIKKAEDFLKWHFENVQVENDKERIPYADLLPRLNEKINLLNSYVEEKADPIVLELLLRMLAVAERTPKIKLIEKQTINALHDAAVLIQQAG
jgi:hypothetical protein